MQCQSSLQLLLCLRVEAKVQVSMPDGVSNRRLHFRLLIELSCDPGCRPIQSRSHLQVQIGFDAGLVGGTRLRQEIILQKIIDRLGCRRFGVRAVALPGRAYALPDAENGRCHEHHNNSSNSCQFSAITAHEFARAVGGGGRHRQHCFVP